MWWEKGKGKKYSSCSSSLSKTKGELRVRCDRESEDRGEHTAWSSRILPLKV